MGSTGIHLCKRTTHVTWDTCHSSSPGPKERPPTRSHDITHNTEKIKDSFTVSRAAPPPFKSLRSLIFHFCSTTERSTQTRSQYIILLKSSLQHRQDQIQHCLFYSYRVRDLYESRGASWVGLGVGVFIFLETERDHLTGQEIIFHGTTGIGNFSLSHF